MNAPPLVHLERARSLQVQITEQVRAQIRAGKWAAGHRLPTTRALAALWGTEATTIHRALATLAKEGWLDRTPRRGTFVRQRAAKLTCVGVYDPQVRFQGSIYEHALHGVLKEELVARGIETDVWLDPRPEDQFAAPWEAFVTAAERREFQAVITISASREAQRWLQRLPVPVALHTLADLPNSVDFDRQQFIELSVGALADQGCRSIGLIAPCRSNHVPRPGEYDLWAAALERFVSLARDHGLVVRNEWMRVAAPDGQAWGPTQERFGYEQFRALWQQPQRPEGLVVFPDATARGVILAARELHVQVPAELKLVLHKNEMIDLLCPMSVTFVVSSERAAARGLIEQLERQLRGEACTPITVPYHLAAYPANTPSRPQTTRSSNESTQEVR